MYTRRMRQREGNEVGMKWDTEMAAQLQRNWPRHSMVVGLPMPSPAHCRHCYVRILHCRWPCGCWCCCCCCHCCTPEHRTAYPEQERERDTFAGNLHTPSLHPSYFPHSSSPPHPHYIHRRAGKALSGRSLQSRAVPVASVPQEKPAS